MNNFQGALEVGNHQIIEMHGAPMAIYRLPLWLLWQPIDFYRALIHWQPNIYGNV